MSTEIKNLNPTALWEIFYDLTQIPRPSKMEAQAMNLPKEFGEKLGLETTLTKQGMSSSRNRQPPDMKTGKGLSSRPTWIWSPRKTAIPSMILRRIPSMHI